MGCALATKYEHNHDHSSVQPTTWKFYETVSGYMVTQVGMYTIVVKPHFETVHLYVCIEAGFKRIVSLFRSN